VTFLDFLFVFSIVFIAPQTGRSSAGSGFKRCSGDVTRLQPPRASAIGARSQNV
jgi:hypothetical protein